MNKIIQNYENRKDEKRKEKIKENIKEKIKPASSDGDTKQFTF